MRFDVAHTTRYQYSKPVFLEPHIIRLRPRDDATQQLIQFEMTIEPRPEGASEYLDAAGNVVTEAWFAGLCQHLTIATRFTVETKRGNPWDYLLPRDSSYDMVELAMLAPYRYAATASGLDNRAASFVIAQTQRLYREFAHVERELGPPRTPAETVALGEGSCRDLAVLLIDRCRKVGLAARFVSGYESASMTEAAPAMHAWTEVYLPGGGWRGFDASRGLAVATGHVAVAAGLDHRGAAPVVGRLRGEASAAMSVAISLQCG